MDKIIFSILVENSSGVLSRVAGLFTRRGYNIDSIAAGVTADPHFTRITVVARVPCYTLGLFLISNLNAGHKIK